MFNKKGNLVLVFNGEIYNFQEIRQDLEDKGYRFKSNTDSEMILYAYDPEIIILGGSVRKAFRFFKEAMWESIRSFAFSSSVKSFKIEVSELEHVAILGAAALHYDAELAFS